jgi:hypothetical protein
MDREMSEDMRMALEVTKLHTLSENMKIHGEREISAEDRLQSRLYTLPLF